MYVQSRPTIFRSFSLLLVSLALVATGWVTPCRDALAGAMHMVHRSRSIHLQAGHETGTCSVVEHCGMHCCAPVTMVSWTAGSHDGPHLRAYTPPTRVVSSSAQLRVSAAPASTPGQLPPFRHCYPQIRLLI
ncbi:MAG: hypothetical protein KGJ74_02785 [Betaproteobacteria bacterium]|nr:hypothetical protein [Betaproteobacteria bacterium]